MQMIKEPDTAELTESKDDLVGQVERAVIDTPESDNKAGDLLKMIKNLIKGANDERTGIVKPINDSVKLINDKYKLITGPLETARTTLTNKMIEYKKEVAKEEQKRIDEENRIAEEKAMEEAAKLESEGKDEAAEQVLESTANVVEKRDKPVSTVRSNHGAVTSMRDNWSAEVTDVIAFAEALIKDFPDYFSKVFEVNQKEINDIARKKKSEKLGIAGIKGVNKPILASR